MKHAFFRFSVRCLAVVAALNPASLYAGPKLYPGQIVVLENEAYVVEKSLGRGALSDIYSVTDQSGQRQALKLYRYGSPGAPEPDLDPNGTVIFSDRGQVDPFPTIPLDPQDEKKVVRTNEEILQGFKLAERLRSPLFLPISKPGIYILRGSSSTYAGHLMPLDHYLTLAEPSLTKLTSLNNPATRDSPFALQRLMILNVLANQLLEMAIAAHAAGVALVDIKPGNITVHPQFLLPQGASVPILRFRDYDSLVEVGSRPISVTPLFTPPEVSRGSQAVDINTDLYSIGLTLLTQMQGYHPARSPSVQVVRQWETIRQGQSADSLVNALFSRWRTFLNRHPEWSERLKTIILHSLNVAPEARLEGLIEAKILSRGAKGQLAVLRGCL